MNDLIKLLDELDYTKINHKIMLDDAEADVLTYSGQIRRFTCRVDICEDLVEVSLFDFARMKACRASTYADLNDDMIDWFMYNVENMENELIEEDK